MTITQSVNTDQNTILSDTTFFKKEYVGYNYSLRPSSESVVYPLSDFSIDSAFYRKMQLNAAAEALYKDYLEDEELTAFSSLDADDIHEQG